MSETLARRLRQSERLTETRLNLRLDPPLSGKDLWKLIATVAATEPRLIGMSPRSRDEASELFGELSIAAAEWMEANPPLSGGYRLSDRAELEANLRAAVRPVLRHYRETRGYELPTGLAALLEYGERQAERRAASNDRERRLTDWQLADGSDPAPDWLRDVVAELPADIAAVVLSGCLPETHRAEWMAADGCGEKAWEARITRGRKKLAEPATREWVANLIRRAEPPNTDAWLRLCRWIAGNGRKESSGATGLPDTGFRETCERAAEVLTTDALPAPMIRKPFIPPVKLPRRAPAPDDYTPPTVAELDAMAAGQRERAAAEIRRARALKGAATRKQRAAEKLAADYANWERRIEPERAPAPVRKLTRAERAAATYWPSLRPLPAITGGACPSPRTYGGRRSARELVRYLSRYL